MTKHSHGKRVSDGGSGRSPVMHRLEQYGNQSSRANWCGLSRADDIARWSKRAAENSQLAPRAAGDARVTPGRQLNHVGSTSYMKNVRRST
jgi:hypothetical protein